MLLGAIILIKMIIIAIIDFKVNLCYLYL